jgi:hypothetical protein
VIVGTLVGSCLLAGCHSAPNAQSTTPQAAGVQSSTSHPSAAQSDSAQTVVPMSPVDLVRNGYLKSNKTTTLGQALVGTYQNGEWKAFASAKGTTVVEFDATVPYSDYEGIYMPIVEKLDAYCNSDAAKTTSSKEQTVWDKEADYNTCLGAAAKQHANDPVPIIVQFTVNHDGTFQYHTNSMGLSENALFEKIYN